MPTLRRLSIWSVILCCTLLVTPQLGAAAIEDTELEMKVKRAMDRGLKWLRSQRQENGSWENHPGITALVLSAYARSHRGYTEEDGPFIRDAVNYLEDLAKPDGSIYDRDLPVYNTAVSVMAFCSLGNRKHAPIIEKARDFLVDKQADEAEGYKSDDKFYGGIGYGNDERPDLSNLQFAMEGLRAANLPKEDPAWDRAIRFLERCQNRSESNDQAWAANDGGFVYAPGHSMAGGTKSYGSMTYAGIKSLIYAHLEKDDPRVVQAMDWIRKNYTVEENPGMGAQGLYYYYNVFAKAMRAHGDSVIEDASGKSHLWADELASEVLSRQYDEGFWMNAESGRWWEGNKVLVTAETVLTLAELLADPGVPQDSCPALSAGGAKGAGR